MPRLRLLPTGSRGPRRARIRAGTALLAVLLALGSTASASRADVSDHTPLTDLPPPPTANPEHRHEGPEDPPISRFMEGGNRRSYAEGQRLRYRVRVEQTLRPHGLYEAPPVASSIDLTLEEEIRERDGAPVVTLRVVDARAEGFLAEAEETAARAREIVYRPLEEALLFELGPDPDVPPDLRDPEAIAGFGELGAIRMVDLALRAHLLNPVLAPGEPEPEVSRQDTAALPAGWTLGAQSFTGSTTLRGEEEVRGRAAARLEGVHVTTDTLLRMRAIDNAVEALQGLERPEPNDFFAGTLFHALFPEGSTYESLMPPLPLGTTTGERRRAAPRPRGRRRRAWLPVAALLLALTACQNPQQNPNLVSLNLTGPIQIRHDTLVDEATGVVLSSRATATARLSGEILGFPAPVTEVLPPELAALSGAKIGMDADWTVTEELEGDPPAGSLAGAVAPAIGLAVLGGAAVAAVLLRRRAAHRSRGENRDPEAAPPATPAGREVPAPDAPHAQGGAASAPPAPEEGDGPEAGPEPSG